MITEWMNALQCYNDDLSKSKEDMYLKSRVSAGSSLVGLTNFKYKSV